MQIQSKRQDTAHKHISNEANCTTDDSLFKLYDGILPRTERTLTDTSRSLGSAVNDNIKHVSPTYCQSLRSEGTETSSKTGAKDGTIRAASLPSNLIRCQNRDPFDIFEVVDVLGEGSMVSDFVVPTGASSVSGGS
jgi:hypothetical protein